MISYLSKTSSTVWNSLWSLAGWKKQEAKSDIAKVDKKEEEKKEEEKKVEEEDQVKSHPLEE
jgi:hypothetical protein